MILREATADDLRPLLALAKKSWTALGIPFDADIDHLRVVKPRDARVVVAYDSLPADRRGPRLLAALAGSPIDTADGPGYQIYLYVTDHDEPDPTLALDAVTLYSCTLANADGRNVIISRRSKSLAAAFYGRDVLGMATLDHDSDLLQVGDARSIAANILQRRPQWAPSL